MENTERAKQISDLYRELLQREPDDGGLMSYFNSDLTIEQIRHVISNSTEYTNLKGKKDFKNNVEKLGNAELLVMGSSPVKKEHYEIIKKTGVQCILDLNEKKPDLDLSWCSDYLNVPIVDGVSIPLESIDKCFDFIYKNVVKERKRVFVHSDKGVSRAPAIMSLFLVAEKGFPFYTALRLVHSKQSNISPNRELISHSVLEHVYSYREKYNTKPMDRIMVNPSFGPHKNNSSLVPGQKKVSKEVAVMKITDSIYGGLVLSPEMLGELYSVGIRTVLDLNIKKKDVGDSRFGSIHLPFFKDQSDILVPMVVRSAGKYSKDGKLFIYCEDNETLKKIADSIVLKVRG